jgi:hypothetical protein
VAETTPDGARVAAEEAFARARKSGTRTLAECLSAALAAAGPLIRQDERERPAQTAGGSQQDDLTAAAAAAGVKASEDEPDSILMADARLLLIAGSHADQLAAALADDLDAKAPAPITRAGCATLVRASCSLRTLAVAGWDALDVLAVLGSAAAKLEMRARS